MRATEKKKIRQQLELKRREANEAYRRSQAVNREATAEPVSYTHLTLPTILLV